MSKLYKIVSTEFGSLHGGTGTWHTPKGSKPGEWMPKIENVQACYRGYHLIPAEAIFAWLPCPPYAGYLCEAEGCGASDKDGDKIAFAEARLLKIVGVLDEKSMRLAAADIAERVLPIFYKVMPKDTRPAFAIQAARDFANGKIERRSQAAWDAARATARAAAWDAAAWDTAAWDAAAWDTAGWDAARNAAVRNAAARNSAGAARYAARAAWDATGAAACAAARAAAGAAATAAARNSAARNAAVRNAAWAAGARAARAANATIIIGCARRRLREAALEDT